MTPEQAPTRELETHYLADEMPAFSLDFSEDILPGWAKISALRLS